MHYFGTFAVGLILAVLAAAPVHSQHVVSHGPLMHGEQLAPVHISDVINNPEFIEWAVEETRRRNPALFDRALEKMAEVTEIAEYEVGDEENFYVLKFEERSGAQYSQGWFDEVEFRLMAAGDMSYIWVSIAELENGHVTDTEVQAILDALESHTPSGSRNPNRGIFELVNEYFGDPPNVGPQGTGTGPGVTNVLLTDIQDGWDPEEGGGYIAGFFFSLDQNISHSFSNRRDIIYIDTYPGIFHPSQDAPNPNRPLSTLAHEYQHLVFHNYRGSSDIETWMNEGLSLYAETVCGYSLRSPALYFENTNRAMNFWGGQASTDDVLQDYSRVALWTLYLAEQMGDDFIRYLVQTSASTGRGIPIVNRAAERVGSALRFPDLLINFSIANALNDMTIAPEYGYEYHLAIRPKPVDSHNDPNVSRQGRLVNRYSVYYIEYSFGDSLEIRFETSSDLTIKAIEIGRETVNVVPIAAGDTYIQYDYGSVYQSIVFALINTGPAGVTIDYFSEGGFRYFVDEYRYDDGTPQPLPSGASFLGFPGTPEFVGSGWAMRFEPEFPENRLLAARLYAAFDSEFGGSDVLPDTPKELYFHVWGNRDGMPGDDLIEPFIVETPRANFPNDFLDVDLFDYADALTDIEGSVYVGFTVPGEHAVYVGMTNREPQNYTYAFFGPNHSGSPNQWRRMNELNVGDASLNGWNMMMRTAFAVHDPDRPGTGIADAFGLAQNYPNPFNTETTIRFDVPEDAHVTIDVYDVLGRRVATLLDEFRQEGAGQSVTWNATDAGGRVVASGVYLYRMRAGDFSAVRKMVLLR
jgi:hypothetical protein